MDKKPRRYRLRFGLKTLFVLIGALAVWLGAVTNQVRERRAALHELRARGVFVMTGSQWAASGAAAGQPIPSIPKIRRWLGDDAIHLIVFYPSHKLSDDERHRLGQLFPEAVIKCVERPHINFLIAGNS
jgi:hypothetical protein